MSTSKDPRAEAVVATHETDAERRHEHRFLVGESVARLVMRTTANNLPLSRDDRPYQWSSTTYCDTRDWGIYRSARTGSAMQLRIREYHRTRPNTVLNPGQAWVEFKDDEDDTSLKERFGVPMEVARAFLRGEPALPDVEHGLAERAIRLLRSGARPVAVTQYNRLAYSAHDSALRITADHNLMYFALPWEARGKDVRPLPLGTLLAMEPEVIVEMKWYGNLPHWAVDLHDYLKQNTKEERPSKFIVAMRWLLGENGHEAA